MWEVGALQGCILSAVSPSPLNAPYIYHDMLEEPLTVLNGIDVMNAYMKLAHGHRRALLQLHLLPALVCVECITVWACGVRLGHVHLGAVGW